MNDMGSDFMRGAVEALLFVSEKPVPVEQFAEAIPGLGAGEIRRYIQELKAEYDQKNRGMVILEIAGGYQMLSSPGYSETVRSFFKTRVKERLSKPALEAMAIVAYKQPVSRTDVEVIRGVNSDGVVLHLLNRGLIKVVGRKEVPGRPFLYGTTKEFLEYFGLKSLSDLPKLEDFASLFSAEAIKNAQSVGSAVAIEPVVTSPVAGNSSDDVVAPESAEVPAEDSPAQEAPAEIASGDPTVANEDSTEFAADLFTSSPVSVDNPVAENVAVDQVTVEENSVISLPSGAALSGEKVPDEMAGF